MTMMRCVLVATDGSDESRAAVETGIELVRSFGPDARLHVATVISYVGVPEVMAKRPPAAPDLLAEAAEIALAQARDIVAAAGMTAGEHLLHGDVVDALLECAHRTGADLLVAGYHGHNRLTRLVMGSVAGKLVRASQIPVVIVGARPPLDFAALRSG